MGKYSASDPPVRNVCEYSCVIGFSATRDPLFQSKTLSRSISKTKPLYCCGIFREIAATARNRPRFPFSSATRNPEEFFESADAGTMI